MKRVKDNSPIIAENKKIAVKIYEDDGGEQHVHFVFKSNGDDLKVSLITLRPLRGTKFDKETVKYCIEWTFENMAYIKRKWSTMRRRIYEEK